MVNLLAQKMFINYNASILRCVIAVVLSQILQCIICMYIHTYTCSQKHTLLYVCPCIIYEIDERYPLDATIYLLL